jgi:hypothetical protein
MKPLLLFHLGKKLAGKKLAGKNLAGKKIGGKKNWREKMAGRKRCQQHFGPQPIL